MGLDGRELFVFLCAVHSGRCARNVGRRSTSYIVRKTERNISWDNAYQCRFSPLHTAR